MSNLSVNALMFLEFVSSFGPSLIFPCASECRLQFSIHKYCNRFNSRLSTRLQKFHRKRKRRWKILAENDYYRAHWSFLQNENFTVHLFLLIWLFFCYTSTLSVDDNTRFCTLSSGQTHIKIYTVFQKRNEEHNENHEELWLGCSYLFYPSSLQQLAGSKMW